MIRISIDVCNGATPSSLVVHAKGVREATSIAAAAYPNADIRVKFPIDPETFFVRDHAVRAGNVSSVERVEEMAA
jgi:hypothetical protein